MEDQADFKAKVMEVIGDSGGDHTARGKELYFAARRSLRFWPVVDIAGSLELGCRNFMTEILSMPVQVVGGLTIEYTRKLQQPRRSKIENEVLVRFPDAATRDIVQSYALNLAQHRDKAGIRLEIPPQLAGTFRLFEQHAGTLRQRFPEGFKRSIKFDDVAMDLVMDIKVPTASKWHRFTRTQIKKAVNSSQSSDDVLERNSILSGASWRTAEDYVEVDDDDESVANE